MLSGSGVRAKLLKTSQTLDRTERQLSLADDSFANRAARCEPTNDYRSPRAAGQSCSRVNDQRTAGRGRARRPRGGSLRARPRLPADNDRFTEHLTASQRTERRHRILKVVNLRDREFDLLLLKQASEFLQIVPARIRG